MDAEQTLRGVSVGDAPLLEKLLSTQLEIVRRRSIVRIPALAAMRRRRTSAGPPVVPPDPVTRPEPRPARPGRRP